MIICCFDTETTGVKPPIFTVQVAAVLIDTRTGQEISHFSTIVKPDGYDSMPPDAERVHGISYEMAQRFGVPRIIAISMLTNLWALADVRVAHNAEYDERVIAAEIERLGKPSAQRRPPVVCTKRLSSPVLKLPPTERMIATGFGGKNKEPSLAECFRFFFQEEVVGAHGALADTRACGRVFLELIRRGVVTDPAVQTAMSM